jgi:transcriptional regulator with XRE-family HTH domain
MPNKVTFVILSYCCNYYICKMKDRILKFLTTENITATSLADEIGVQRSSISHILSGRNYPSFDFIQKLLSRYKKLNAEWLIMGTGNMFKMYEQQSLFDQAPPSNPNPKQAPAQEYQGTQQIQLPEEIPSESSFPGNGSNSDKILASPEDKKNTSRQIDRIVIFYTDQTFEEYKKA